MRQPLLAAVAAGFIGACGVSVATSREAPAPGGGPVAARERPASPPDGLRELAPLPALRRAPRSATRTPAVAVALQAASPPPAPPPAQQPVATPSAPVAAPKEPAPSPAPEFDSSEEVFDSSG